MEEFASFDTNQDGWIDPDELRAKFEGISSWEVSATFIAGDSDEDGLLDKEEFLTLRERFESREIDLRDFYFY